MGTRILGFWALAVFCTLLSPASFASNELTVIGKFRNTYYYSVLEDDYKDEPLNVQILDINDQLIARVSRAFRKALDMEGTGKLTDGRVVNFASRKPDGIRYHVTQHRFGRGVGDCALIPFRSIAVDPEKIALGSLVQIDETIGMVLPDGSIHDGIWRAEDVGGAIREDRIDLFVGEGDQGHVLRKAGIVNKAPLTVRISSPPQKDSCVDQPPTQNQ